MDRIDRLSSLISRFRIEATPIAGAIHVDASDCYLLVLASEAGGRCVRLGPVDPALWRQKRPLAAARIDFGEQDAPLARGLPCGICVDVSEQPQIEATAGLLVAEAQSARCGGAAAFQRLAELLIIQLLRHAIETGVSDGGLLAGLSDARLARALTAMHDAPEVSWTTERLASHAGMSRARFIEHFNRTLGETPMRYLTGFRMLLARQALEDGARVGEVAHRFGYSAPDAFARAYRRRFGTAPRTARISDRKTPRAAGKA